MLRKKFYRLILVLSCLALSPILGAESTTPERPGSKPEPTQALPQDLPIYTESEVVEALRIASQAAAQAALDKALPLAIQAAVAEKEGERATAQRFADLWKEEATAAKSKIWKAFGWGSGTGFTLAILGVITTALLTR